MKIRLSNLKMDDIPETCEDWRNFSLFVFSIDATEINPMEIDEQEFVALGDKLSSEQIGSFLYLQQRRWNHFGRMPDDEAVEITNRFLSLLRTKCSN